MKNPVLPIVLVSSLILCPLTVVAQVASTTASVAGTGFRPQSVGGANPRPQSVGGANPRPTSSLPVWVGTVLTILGF